MHPSSEIPEKTKQQIAWESQSIFERLELLESSSNTEIPDMADYRETDDEFMSEWCEIVANGNRVEFYDRIEREGALPRIVQYCTTLSDWPADVSLPQWIDELELLIDSSRKVPVETTVEAYTEEPFVHILAAWVEYSYNKLTEETPLKCFSKDAISEMKNWLLSRYKQFTVKALYVNFRTHIVLQNPSILYENSENGTPPTDLYFDFVDKMSHPKELLSFFKEYPVIARLLITAHHQWIDAIETLDSHLRDDWSEIREEFAVDLENPNVENISVLTDDRHKNGKSVFCISFADGQKVVYKPRSVQSETIFYTIVESISAEMDIELPSLTVLDKGKYGWVEYKPHQTCESTQEVERYYQRAGGMLGIAYLLNLNDGHFENVVAHGEYPIIVDTETILHPPQIKPRSAQKDPSHTEIYESVLWTGLLPRSWSGENGEGGDKTCGFEVPVINRTKSEWKNLNTDWMSVVKQEDVDAQPESKNIPKLKNEPIKADEYIDKIVYGFKQATSAGAKKLGANDEISERLSNLETRVICESTERYQSVIASITAPKTLRDGRRITIECDHLLVDDDVQNTDSNAFWDIFDAERRSIRQLDVPRFTSFASTGLINTETKEVDDLVSHSGYDLFTKQLKELDSEEIEKQIDYIRLSLGNPDNDGQSGENDFCSREGVLNSSSQSKHSSTIRKEDIKSFVKDIYDDIVDLEQQDHGGYPTWLLRQKSHDDRLQVRLTDNGLHTGRSGIALFFALVSNHYGFPGARKKSLDTLAPISNQVQQLNLSEHGLGLDNGAGAWIYAFCRIGELLNEPTLVDDAETIAQKITLELIRSDTEYDLLNGSAGGILGLLALYNLRPEDWICERARQCGTHLIEQRTTVDSDHTAWKTVEDKKPLTGFSHGAAGISYALSRLYNITSERRYKRAATAGINYERNEYCQERQNWPDHRYDPPQYTDAWCHGRTGIALSRIGMKFQNYLTVTQEDFERTAGTLKRSPADLDHLCCGTSGRADTLLELSRHVDNQTYEDAAIQLLEHVIQTGDTKKLNLPGHRRHLYNPSLFAGTAGIGYALIRLTHPEVKSVLLYEI